jgi:hypothetical protein
MPNGSAMPWSLSHWYCSSTSAIHAMPAIGASSWAP